MVISGENLQKELANFKAKLASGNLDAGTRDFVQKTIEDMQRQYDELEQQKAQYQDDPFRQKQIESEQQEISAQLRDMERAGQQAAELDDIQLPQDYNTIFADPRANDEIKSLIRQAKEQLFTKHNNDLADVHSSHKEAMDKAQSTIGELTDQHAKLQQIYEAEQAAHAVTKSKLMDEQQARQDAEQKRDNAVTQLEQAQAERDKALKQVDSLNSQINELEGMVKALKKPAAPTGGLTFTSTLKPETDEERAARLKREEVERINRNLAERHGLPPLKLPELPSNPTEEVTSEQLDAAFPGMAGSPTVSRDDAGGTGVQQAAEAVDATGDAEATPTLTVLAAEISELKIRVARLEGAKI